MNLTIPYLCYTAAVTSLTKNLHPTLNPWLTLFVTNTYYIVSKTFYKFSIIYKVSKYANT